MTVWDVLPNQLDEPQLKDISLDDDPFWGNYQNNATNVTIHIAILAKKYLNLILSKDKTIESRFSVTRRMPYNRVKHGDIVLLKETGGLILGMGFVSGVEFMDFRNDNVSLDRIKQQYANALQIDDDGYWDKYSKSSYGTLIHLDHVRPITPMKFSKRDRNAWVMFTPNQN